MTRTAPMSPERQLLERARENPSAHIRELTELAERNTSLEAGMAAIMLMLVYLKQKDKDRVIYFQKKSERCKLNGDARLALLKLMSGENQLPHLQAALAENHAPTLKYILEERKKEFENNGWYALLANAAALWSRHPENTNEFEREDAAIYARLWGTEPDPKLAAREQKDRKREKMKEVCGWVFRQMLSLLIALVGVGFIVYMFKAQRWELWWLACIAGFVSFGSFLMFLIGFQELRTLQ